MNPRKAGLALEGLGKRFGDTESVSDVTLRVGPGELMALLGSSGAGKSTILRCIAGHLEPDAGEIWIGGERMDQAPPEKRNVGMVFQSYALFPHLTVRRNVAFGPERRGASRSEATELADEMLDRVGLLELGDRYPRQISGGEQQRVAVARALAIRPEVLLLDEPLSSLDQTLRRELRSLLHRLQRSFGATTVWVTHDQEEALTVADRVAVLDRGRLQQVGTPLELHTRPANTFVASFVGKMNLLPATREAASGDAFRLADGPVLRVARDALPGPASPGPASPRHPPGRHPRIPPVRAPALCWQCGRRWFRSVTLRRRPASTGLAPLSGGSRSSETVWRSNSNSRAGTGCWRAETPCSRVSPGKETGSASTGRSPTPGFSNHPSRTCSPLAIAP